MLRFSKKCDYCGNEMDSFDEKCSSCHEENHDKAAKRCKNMAFYPFWKQLLFFATGLGGLYIVSYTLKFILGLAGKSSAPLINFGSYILLFALMLLIIWDNYHPLFKSFKGWKPFVFGVIGYLVIYLFDLVNVTSSSIIIKLIFGSDSSINQNQAAINNVVNVQPLMSLLVFGIIGPICEELAYRVGLFSFLRRINVVLAYAVGIIVFALIHFDTGCVVDVISDPHSVSNWYVFAKEMFSFPSYLFAGGVFTFLYHKFGFASSLTAHVSNNFIGIAFNIILNQIEKLFQ